VVPSNKVHFAPLEFNEFSLRVFHKLNSWIKLLGAKVGEYRIPKTSNPMLISDGSNKLFLMTQENLEEKKYVIHPSWRLFVFENKVIAMDFSHNFSKTLSGKEALVMKDFLSKKICSQDVSTLRDLPFIVEI
jgi:hypothetical protein